MSIQMILIVADIIAFIAFGLAKSKLKPHVFRILSLVVQAFYMAAVLYITIFTRQPLVEPRWNIIPFPKDVLTDVFYHEFIINVLIFMPIGFLLSGIFPQLKLVYTILAGIGISICYELIQFFFHVGVCDINNLIASSIGCILSVSLAQIFRGFPKTRK